MWTFLVLSCTLILLAYTYGNLALLHQVSNEIFIYLFPFFFAESGKTQFTDRQVCVNFFVHKRYICHLYISHDMPCLSPKFCEPLFLIPSGYYSGPKRNWRQSLYAKFRGANNVHFRRCANGECYWYHGALSCLMRNSKSLKLMICKIFELMVMV